MALDVSVVIPTRDRWPWLHHTLAETLQQEGVELEVVVVDDASTEPPPPALAEADSRVRLISLERHGGPSAARNAGLEVARAPWVAFLDDDDLWAPGKLATQLDMCLRKGADFAFCTAVVVDADLLPIRIEEPPSESLELTTALLQRNVIPAGASNVLVRRGLVMEVGGFDETFRHFGDWDLWIRLSAAGRGVAIREALVAVREHPSNMFLSELDSKSLRREFDALTNKHDHLIARYDACPDRQYFRHWLASGYRRRARRFSAAREYMRSAVERRRPGNLLLAIRVVLGEWAMGRPHSRPPLGDAPAWLEATSGRDKARATAKANRPS